MNMNDWRTGNGAVWVAGETSGDFIASLMLTQTAQRMEGERQMGVGGARMQEAGLEKWYDIDRLSVRGYVEVLGKIPGILALRRALLKRIEQTSPRVYVGVDAPDFNLGIEEKVRRAGLPTVHVVSPSIWAWRPERIHQIRRAVSHMLLVFPFEEEIYRKAGIAATYVGHPLASIIPITPDTEGARASLKVDSHGEPVIAVLPGSRVDEIKGLAPVFMQACNQFVQRVGGGRFVFAAMTEASREALIRMAGTYPALLNRVSVFVGQSHKVLEASDGVMVASGTAALEAALFKKPMVVAYRMPGISAMAMKSKGLIPYVSLPNILSHERVVPELLHYFCEPDAIACAMINELRPSRVSELEERFCAIHETLIRPTGEMASEVISTVAKR